MKKVVFSFTLCTLITLWGKTDKHSQTFLFTRPAYQNISLNQALWHGSFFDTTKNNAFQLSFVYQKSYRSDHIRNYFLQSDDPYIKINRTALDRNALPEWFGLPDDFSGLMTVSPEQKQYAGIFEFRKNLGPLFNSEFFKDWWLSAMTTVSQVENNLHLQQSNVQNAASTNLTVYDILTAYNNPEWDYLKINGRTKDTHIPEVRIVVGTTVLSTSNGAYAASYSGFSIPTKKKLHNHHMFEAQVGFNGHVGIIWGLNLQAPLTKKEDALQILFDINLENNFLIRNHQYRTFDLHDKKWSRYLTMRKKDQITNTVTPGVNVLTHISRVSPHALIDFSTSLRFHYLSLEAEIGYGLWAYGGDSIKFTTPFAQEYGIAGTVTNTSASASTITTRAANDTTFTVIKESDIDLSSGAMHPALVNKFHTSFGFTHQGQVYTAHGSLGGFVEFPRNSTKALATWGIMAKAGSAF